VTLITYLTKKLSYCRETAQHATLIKSWDSDYITEMAEPKVVKICTQVSYINSSNMMTYQPQKGRGYGHVTVLKFCRLLTLVKNC